MSIIDWIKEEPAPVKIPERKPDVYLLVRVRNDLALKEVRSALHALGADDIPIRKDAHNWPYICGSKGKAEDYYSAVDNMFTSVMNYAKRLRVRQRDFNRVPVDNRWIRT